MSTKFEKKSKRKFDTKPKRFHGRPRNPNPRNWHSMSFKFHCQHIGPYDWLPIPKELYPAYLADIAKAEKLRAEGKPLEKNMFSKYFEGKEEECKPKPLANWKQVLNEMEEKKVARVKADTLKRKIEAYHMTKDPQLLSEIKEGDFGRFKADALKRKKKEQQLLAECV